MALVPRATTTPAPYTVPSTAQFEGNDGSWSTFYISVGTPPQTFRVLISTASGEVWVPVPDGCTSSDPSNCGSLRGAETFNGQASNGFLTNQSSTWQEIGLYGLDWEKNLNYTGNGHYGYDTVKLGMGQDGSAISLDKDVVAGIATKSFWFGALGLGLNPSTFGGVSPPTSITSLKAQNKIPSLSFSYQAGASYRGKKIPGSLILGGYDTTRFKGSPMSFSFGQQVSRQLMVGVQSIIATNTLLGVASFTSGANSGYLTLVDSTVSHIWLPRQVCDLMANAFGLTYDNATDLYLVNDTIHSQLLSKNPQITFKIGNTIYDNGNNTNIVLPYAAFDLQVGSPYYDSSKYYFPIRRAANDTQYTLGRAFLQEAYLTVDYERQNFSIAQAQWPDPLPAAQIVTISSANATSTSSSSSSISTGAIAGIAVGAAAIALIAIGLLLYFCWWRKRPGYVRKPKKGAELENTQVAAQLSESKDGYKPPADGSYFSPHYQAPHQLEAESNQRHELGAHGIFDPKKDNLDIYQQQQYGAWNRQPHELPTPPPQQPWVHELPTPPHQGGIGGVHEMPGEYYVPHSPGSQSPSRTPSRSQTPRKKWRRKSLKS